MANNICKPDDSVFLNDVLLDLLGKLIAVTVLVDICWNVDDFLLNVFLRLWFVWNFDCIYFQLVFLLRTLDFLSSIKDWFFCQLILADLFFDRVLGGSLNRSVVDWELSIFEVKVLLMVSENGVQGNVALQLKVLKVYLSLFGNTLKTVQVVVLL